jgi:hypothetical protein
MRASHYLFQIFDVEVRVDLRAPHACVPQDRLDITEIRAVTQHMSRHRMPEDRRKIAPVQCHMEN